ncbi:efflux RND transporter periplasmic adaptor subunit [Streptacidiphilus griseoplanus]|uniref:efflux RND transporter periplasmic adaptor subunit n=1 Tax=Peterkaempfera griseoplana TaxID=66896 RepID=UPI0006E2E025|nr:peptidoglycan-binding protein [Peterkaempfera griseoplana]
MTAAIENSAQVHDENPRRSRRRRHRVTWLTAVLAVAAVGGGTFYAVNGSGPAPTSTASAPRESTATVTRQTLVNTQQVDGTLGYAGSTTVKGQLAGIVTGLPGIGSTVSRGGTLYSVDGTPVVLLYGSIPAYRDLKPGDSGADVRQLESNLQALGYDGFTVGDRYTNAFAQAVERWQKNLGLPAAERTGTVTLGSVVYATGALRIGTHNASVGDSVGPGAPVVTGTSSHRQVHVDLNIDYQSLAAKNAKVTVQLPNGTTVNGTITSVGTTVTTTPGTGGNPSTSTIGVDIALADADTGGYSAAPVTVNLQSAEKKDVLTVPITALLALSEGGYGVQVTGADGRSTIVTVTLGMFADGRVEVTGPGLKAGTVVEVAL